MTEDSLIGKQLGEYQIESLLAQGGMARVYRAMDVRLKRRAVVKLIDPPSRNDPGYVTRFEREAQTIGRLDHPNIVRLYRFDEQDGWLYMAMQHIEGTDLGVVLAGYRADQELMDPEDARRIVREICSALDYAHHEGVIHRDVKPANILLDRQGRAYLSDFGLALITEIGTRGEIFGSAHYIAPEQAVSSAKAVPQSDLYAIGVILYEMFTGDVPFKAATPLDIALLHISEPPVPPRQLRPDINPELETVILKALAKKPEERYPTGAALSDALELALNARSAATLLAPRSAASRQTIPERVALKLGQQQLPPIPAAVVVSTPPTPEKSVPAEPIASPANKQPLINTRAVAGLGVILLLVLLCSALVVLPSLMNRFGWGGNLLANQTPAAEVGESVASSIAFAESSATLPAIQPDTASPTTPPLTGIPESYKLLIVRGEDGNSLVVVNKAADVFPLSLLQLKSGKDVLAGAEWGIDNLESEACVGAWKAGEELEPPHGEDCELVGKKLVRKKKELFGGDSFVVFYAGEQVGTCHKDQEKCWIMIFP